MHGSGMSLLLWSLPFIASYVLLFVGRRRLGGFWSVVLFVVAALVHLKVAIHPPIPASAFRLYSVTIILAATLYVTSNTGQLAAFRAGLTELVTSSRFRVLRLTLLVLVPGALGLQGWAAMQVEVAPPAVFRAVHPAPPTQIRFQGPDDKEEQTIDLTKVRSPVRELEHSDPKAFEAAVAAGKTVYYQNCWYCHGDDLAGNGPYSAALNPRPANFQDPGTIAMLQESFLFWRIAKGGAGLPAESTPWNSAMPAWEDYLSQEQIWQVIAFLYDHTDQVPREFSEGEH